MTVGQLVRETLQLQRALLCDHDWKPFAGESNTEQCARCEVVATPEGKKHLAALASRKFR